MRASGGIFFVWSRRNGGRKGCGRLGAIPPGQSYQWIALRREWARPARRSRSASGWSLGAFSRASPAGIEALIYHSSGMEGFQAKMRRFSRRKRRVRRRGESATSAVRRTSSERPPAVPPAFSAGWRAPRSRRPGTVPLQGTRRRRREGGGAGRRHGRAPRARRPRRAAV